MKNQIIPERLEKLETLTLNKGSHGNFDDGHCAMEVVSWLAGQGFTDAPECASPVLRTYTIGLNDQWDDTNRQKLIPFLPRMVGTAGDGKDETRSYLALDWLVRTYTPAWLDLAGLTAEATELRNLRRLVDIVSTSETLPALKNARSKSAAAGAAAWDAARAAARAAAWDAAGAAARDAAWDAAWAAAGAAAWDAAGAAARDAARSAARDAAWAAARAAARDAAWAAARAAAWDAARAAARAALKPTVEALQASALLLLDSMIDPEVTA